MEKQNAIEFRSVSKRFKKGQKLLLKEALLDILSFKSKDYFFALDNVSFSVKKGETFGIIGKNGSGKSTIMKLVAGVIVPTTGKVVVSGKIAPLIELGAGFHPELSGRDNIYINGAILGLSRKKIDERFASIVSFAELEQFIDTPVKHYSSGMYMRLGFSIAVHTDPQILLIDEILAVGDEAFQKKCYVKLEEFKKLGSTIIFVSHNMTLVERYCDRVIILESGHVKTSGSPGAVIKAYFNQSSIPSRQEAGRDKKI